MVGVVVASDIPPACDPSRLRPLDAVLDDRPMLDQSMLDFLLWAARYYHHPPGEAVLAALPLRLRRPCAPVGLEQTVIQLTAAGSEAIGSERLRRAPRQAEILQWLRTQPGREGLQTAFRQVFPAAASSLRALERKGWLRLTQQAPAVVAGQASRDQLPVLSDEQAVAVDELVRGLGAFSVSLLEGVTGSGKTEVYLRLAASVLARGDAVMILVPEIALTPQLFSRFRDRLGSGVRLLHSGLADAERELAWHEIRLGRGSVVLGTRSAVFTPVPRLGLVVVDEEHDPSLKQAEGYRYSARDLAIVRAQRAGCPVLLGSATPSLESLTHARSGRYRHLRLRHRAGLARPPRVALIDLRDQPLRNGLSETLLHTLSETLQRGEQAMLFLNRRGFAPVLSCFSCGWVSDCPLCDAHQTVHRGSGRLICHHCGAQRRVPTRCPSCDAADLHPLGQGTEQLEQVLAERFPDCPLIRIDRDATARKGSLEALLERLSAPGPALLVGTQMLAKGHHFPRVTLVAVVDADGGLFSADYRATERLAQLLVQVAGRAGRGEHRGRVLIQTRFPDHPLLQTLVTEGYSAFAQAALEERAAAELPPFSHQALLRADAPRMDAALDFLRSAVSGIGDVPSGQAVRVWGPVAAPMARRAGRERAQVLLQAERREPLHRVLDRLVERLPTLSGMPQVRWGLDVDPIDLF
jgi:primosomal protein N' (replication factor Y)